MDKREESAAPVKWKWVPADLNLIRIPVAKPAGTANGCAVPAKK